jgi:hypothetical protein
MMKVRIRRPAHEEKEKRHSRRREVRNTGVWYIVFGRLIISARLGPKRSPGFSVSPIKNARQEDLKCFQA